MIMNRRQFLQGLSVGSLAGICGGCSYAEYLWNSVEGELKSASDMFIKPFFTTTIMSWNIHAGIGEDGNYDLSRIAEEIKRVDADVVLLQEVDRKTRRARGSDQVTLLEEATEMKAHFLRTGIRTGGETGLVILSPKEPLTVNTLNLPGDGRLLIAEFPEYCAGNIHFGEYTEDRTESLEILRRTIAMDRPLFLCGNWREEFTTPFLRDMRNSFSILTSAESLYETSKEADNADYIAVSRRHRQRFEHVTRIPCEALTASTHRPLAVKVR